MANVGYINKLEFNNGRRNQELFHCEKYFYDSESDKSTLSEQLENCLDSLEEGDTLVILELSFLAGSLRKLSEILEILNPPLRTTDSTREHICRFIGIVNQEYQFLRKQKQIKGIKNAIVKGQKFGRNSKLSKDEIDNLLAQHRSGEKVQILAEKFGISIRTVYRVLEKQSG